MSSDVSLVTNHFATANEGFNTTTSNTTNSGANTVGLNSVSGLTNGSVFVGVIEPGEAKEQVFTGTVDTGDSQITGVVWTKGTNIEHATGVSVVDYDTGTGFNMLRKGVQVHADQDGTLKAGAVDNAAVLASDVVTTAKILDANVTNTKLGTDISPVKFANPYKFLVYLSSSISVLPIATNRIPFDTAEYDTGSNVDLVTNKGRFTAPVSGFYHIDATILWSSGAANNSGKGYAIAMTKNGTQYKSGVHGIHMYTSAFTIGATLSTTIQLVAGDYLEVFDPYGLNGSTIVINGGSSSTVFSGFLVSKT